MRSKTGAAFLLIGVFLLGGVAGATAYYTYRNHLVSAEPAKSRTPRRDIVQEMSQSLKLDARQQEQLRAIFDQSRDRYDALAVQFQPQYERIRAETNEAIRAILQPEQRTQFDETLQKMDNRHRGQMRDGPPPAFPRPPGASK